jgi:hypothetical protein
MLPDGYYSAAAGNAATPQPGAPGGPATGYGAGGYAPTGYGATQTAGAAGAAGAGWMQPQTPAWPREQGGGTPTPWPQYGASGTGGAGGLPGTGLPGSGGTPVQHTPGRRKPMRSEVPPHVLLSIRLIWAGLAAGLLELVFALVLLGKYDSVAGPHPVTTTELSAQSMAGTVALAGVIPSFLGLFCWFWLARACRRGRGWTRIAAAVLAAIDTACLLLLILGTHDIAAAGTHDTALKAVACLPWLAGLASAVLLWGNQARAFFLAWRKLFAYPVIREAGPVELR